MLKKNSRRAYLLPVPGIVFNFSKPEPFVHFILKTSGNLKHAQLYIEE